MENKLGPCGVSVSLPSKFEHIYMSIVEAFLNKYAEKKPIPVPMTLPDGRAMSDMIDPDVFQALNKTKTLDIHKAREVFEFFEIDYLVDATDLLLASRLRYNPKSTIATFHDKYMTLAAKDIVYDDFPFME